MDTDSSLPNMQPGFARLAQNCDIGPEGSWLKRRGYRPQCTVQPWQNYRIRQGIQFRPLNGDEQVVFFGSGGSGGALGREAAIDPWQEDIIFHVNFQNNNFDAYYATGSDVGTPTNATLTTINSSVQAKITGNPPLSTLSYDPSGGNWAKDLGGIAFRWTPDYNGAALVLDNLLACFISGPGVDPLRVDLTTGGTMVTNFVTTAGSVSQAVPFVAIQGREYYFEWYWDVEQGKLWWFIDGILQTGAALTYTAGASTGKLPTFLVFDPLTNPQDYYVDDVTVYDAVKATANHAVPTRSQTDLSLSTGCIETFDTSLSGDRAYFASIRGQLHIYDGSLSPKAYDGTNVKQIGIDQPSAIPTGVAGTGGDLNEQASYVFAYAYRNNDTGAESTPRISDTVELAAGEDKATLTLQAGDPALADVTVIYRTTANGSILFKEAEISISAISHESTIADNLLGVVQLELDNSRITQFTSSPTYPRVINNRVFVKTGRNEWRFSKIGQTGPMPESFEVKSFVNTEGSYSGADDDVGMGSARDIPIVIKERSIGRLDEAGIPDVGISADLVTYVYREISDAVGGVGHEAGCQVYDEYIFLGRDGVYATNGQGVRVIASPIQNLIAGLGFDGNVNYRLSAVNDRVNRRVYISAFAKSGDQEPNYVLVGDYHAYPNFRWTVYTQGSDGLDKNGKTTSATTHPGIQAGCFFELVRQGGSEIYFGNSNGNGQWYKMNTGLEDEIEPGDKKGIYWKLIGRAYHFEQPMIEKTFKDTEFFALGKGSGYQLHLSSIYDMSGNELKNKRFTLPTLGSTWGDNGPGDNNPNHPNNLDTLGIWRDNTLPDDQQPEGTGIWGGQIIKRLNYDPHKKARFCQPVFEQTEANAPIELFGWGVSASMGRPR